MSKPLIPEIATKNFIDLAYKITEHKIYLLKPKEIRIILEYLVLLILENQDEIKKVRKNNGL